MRLFVADDQAGLKATRRTNLNISEVDEALPRDRIAEITGSKLLYRIERTRTREDYL